MQVFNYKALKSALNRTAKTYDAHAKVAKLTGETLLERLQILKSKPKKILDLGSGTGQMSEHLSKIYPDADIYNLDLAEQRLQISKKNEQTFAICANAHLLPFPNESFDLVVSNLCWHWLDDPEQAINEAHRILKPKGAILFSTLGPDTLYELRSAFAKISPHPHINLFFDMHDLGDALLKAGFSDPVMDVEYFNLEFKDLEQLLTMLKNTGEGNYLQSRFQGLSSKNLKTQLKAAYEKYKQNDTYPATIEVIYALAFRIEIKQQIENNEISIPLTQIKKRNI